MSNPPLVLSSKDSFALELLGTGPPSEPLLSDHDERYEPGISALVKMGFPRDVSKSALHRLNGDIPAAADHILTNYASSDTQSDLDIKRDNLPDDSATGFSCSFSFQISTVTWA